MIAGKWFDLCIGLDIHFVIVPPSPAPVPLPHPFVGLIYDPAGLIVGAAIAGGMAAFSEAPFKGPVLVNSLPSAHTGVQTTNKMTMPHIPTPPGVSWYFGKPPANDGSIVTGSKTVYFSGSNAVRLGDLVMTCGEPVRLPTSTIIAIPMGFPVLVGGPPTLDVLAALMASIRTQWISGKLHALLGAAEGSWTSKIICLFTGHPVDVVTGMVMTDAVDLRLPGSIPCLFERTYYSRSNYQGPLGHGWAHTYDQHIHVERKRIVLHAGDGRDLYFRNIEVGGTTQNISERLILRRFEDRFVVETHNRLSYHFLCQGRADGGFSLARIENRAGDHLQLSYDQRGSLLQVTDTVGRQIRLVTDQTGRLIALEVPHPEQPQQRLEIARFKYDASGDLCSVRDALGNEQRYVYKNHLMVQETNRNGFSFYFAYDGIDNDAKCIRTWGDGGLYDHALTYDKGGRTTVVEDSLGNKTTYFSNEYGLVAKKIDPIGGVTSYDWNEFWRKKSETDADGNTTHFNYDEAGNCCEQIFPDGARVRVRFDDANKPVEAVSRAGGIGKWTYDAVGHVTSYVNPSGNYTIFDYESGRLNSIAYARGGRKTLAYDDYGNLVNVRLDDGAEFAWTYDELGRVIGSKDPQGRIRRARRDLLGRLIEVREPDGQVRQLEYDGEGNVTHYKDSTTDVTMTYSGMRKLRTFTKDNATVEYVHDTEGRLLRVKNQVGHCYQFEMDPAGRVIATVGYDGRRTLYTLSPAGKKVQIILPSGFSYKLDYDIAGRLVNVTNSNGEAVNYEYGADGNLVKAEKKAVMLTFERDIMGRIIKESMDNTWVSYDYDREGYRVGTASSRGFVETFDRSTRGYVERIAFGYRLPGCEIKFKRDSGGREREREFAGGVTALRDYDSIGRLRFQEFGGVRRRRRSRNYEWEGDLRLCSVADSVRGREVFGRDTNGKLAWARDADGTVDVRALDEVGNCYKSFDRSDREYDACGRLVKTNGITYEYDMDGNLIRKNSSDGKVWKYTWDGWGMLEEVLRPDGAAVRFTYDALGRRVSKSFQGRTTRWVWDGNTPLHETTSQQLIGGKRSDTYRAPELDHPAASDITWLFDPDTFSPMGKLDGNRHTAVIADHLGTPIAMFNSFGETTWSAELDLWGKPRLDSQNTSECPFRWPGQYQDDETGLSYNRFRYYDPDAGTYISEDPTSLLGGLALYAYSGDVKASCDPFGLDPLPVLIGESQRRLRDAAAQEGAEWIGPVWPKHLWPVTAENLGECKLFNQEWLQRMMDEGRTIIDIGRDPLRPRNYGDNLFDFYGMEKDMLDKANYPREEPKTYCK